MATVIIPGKVCKHCGGERWMEIYHMYKGERRKYYECAKKNNEYVKKWNEDHPGTVKKYHKSPKGKDSLNKARKKERDTLTDNYIRNQLWNREHRKGIYLVRMDIPKEQIDAYRQALIVKREKRTT